MQRVLGIIRVMCDQYKWLVLIFLVVVLTWVLAALVRVVVAVAVVQLLVSKLYDFLDEVSKDHQHLWVAAQLVLWYEQPKKRKCENCINHMDYSTFEEDIAKGRKLNQSNKSIRSVFL